MTIRLRLTLLYGLLFLTAGGALLAISYGIVRHQLPAGQLRAVSVQDVRNRALTLVKVTKLDEQTRGVLVTISNSSDTAIEALIKNPSTVPVQVAKPLLEALPSTVRSDALHKLLAASLIAMGIMVIVATGLGWLVAGRFVRPIAMITDTARRLSAANLDERLSLNGPADELKRLGDTFDAMLDRLQAAFEGQDRFIANASHELRTPLTIMRTEIEVALRQPNTTTDEFRRMADVVRSTLDRSDRLVTSLLALAAAKHGPDVFEPVDLAVVVQTALHHHRAAAEARHLLVSFELDCASILADPGLIDRLAENLIDNAVVHNCDGGWIEIRTASDAGEATMHVSNSGPVITGDIERLFEPFQRGDRTVGAPTPGNRNIGIGLSIVRSVVQAHGGTVSAEPLPTGGLHVVARLPLAAQPA